MGFDIVHFNLHKTFTSRTAAAGPARGRSRVSDRIEPVPARAPGGARRGRRRPGRFDLDSTGRSRSASCAAFQGNFGMLVRAYAYIRSLGADGLREVSENAVLNANYLKARLAEAG